MADLKRIKITRIESGKVGAGKLVPRGVVRGKIGFWENSSPEGSTYTPRIFIERSPIFPKQTYISPTPESEVLAKGGIPMDENHPNLQTLRAAPHLVKQNFIVAALIVFSRTYTGIPLVLQFDTYRPYRIIPSSSLRYSFIPRSEDV